AASGKKKELLKLLGRLVDVADAKDRRAELRLEAAKVSDELDATSDAIDQLNAILEDDAAHKDAALMLSRLLEKSGRDDDLAELLNKQIELAQGRGDVSDELSYRVRLGEVQETRIGDLEKAVASFSAILDRDAQHKDALTAVARIQEKRGEKAEAAKYYERLLDLQSGEQAIATAKHLAQLFESLSDDDGVQRALERGLTIQEREEEIRTKLRQLYEKRQNYKALSQLLLGDARASEEVPEKVRILRVVADIHKKKLDDAQTAADLLQEASELVPQDRELLLALCDAYSDSGRGRQAVEVLQKIVDSYGGRRSKEVAGIHHRLARAYLADGERQKALAELDTAFKIDPGAIAVLRDLGVLALELADTDAEQKDAYIDRAGKTFKALLLQRLDEGAPITKAEVFYYLGEVSHRQGDDKKGIQMLERALDNDKNLEKAKDLLAKLRK
ncbi:MAG: tetratricopeptide repeat protein, partial [Myxococcales bacterium]|nr:tetratricopeptide repeat protein [Myxococcales bacterium]